MPIATCFIRDRLASPAAVEGLVKFWSEESDISADHMTINVLDGTRQAGASYAVMAVLYLPSLWAVDQVRQLQVGLATALARGFKVPLGEIHVITTLVESGHVVEEGEIQKW